MKTISLWQPHASAIPAGLKTIETRSWHIQRGGITELPIPLAIHAAKRWTGDEMAFYAEHVLKDEQALAAFARLGIDGTPPLGCIVAIAELYQCTQTTDLLIDGVTEQEQQWGNFGPGRYAWMLRNVRPITPVPCVGRQGFFEWEPV